MSEIYVLRLFHRVSRDKRITSHLALTARALGAKGMYFCGQQDEVVIETVEKVVGKWGGEFKVKYIKDYVDFMKTWKSTGGEVIHLTMYGIPIYEVINDIKWSDKRKLIVVGSEKVPSIVYKLADWNVSITNQPHSEVSALAIFLHEFYGGEELKKDFKKAKIKIIPQMKGKKIIITNK